MELLKAMRLLGDEGRVRMLRLLSQEELNVAELQEILGMGQSRISMQLSALKQAGLVHLRHSGRQSLYRAAALPGAEAIVDEIIRRSAAEISEAHHDDRALQLILNRRKDKLRGYFDELAGRFGRNYVPGRSWQALSEMLLRLLPPLDIADLGAGEGTLALLLAQRAKRVIAVDNSEKMVEYGQSVADRNGVTNLQYRRGDLEALPIADSEVDLALMHQVLHHALHPAAAVAEAFRIIRPGGSIVVLDLLKHEVQAAREMYADVWLGFSQVELIDLLQSAGFEQSETSIVFREEEAPHFQTVLATARKAG